MSKYIDDECSEQSDDELVNNKAMDMFDSEGEASEEEPTEEDKAFLDDEDESDNILQRAKISSPLKKKKKLVKKADKIEDPTLIPEFDEEDDPPMKDKHDDTMEMAQPRSPPPMTQPFDLQLSDDEPKTPPPKQKKKKSVMEISSSSLTKEALEKGTRAPIKSKKTVVNFPKDYDNPQKTGKELDTLLKRINSDVKYYEKNRAKVVVELGVYLQRYKTND